MAGDGGSPEANPDYNPQTGKIENNINFRSPTGFTPNPNMYSGTLFNGPTGSNMFSPRYVPTPGAGSFGNANAISDFSGNNKSSGMLGGSNGSGFDLKNLLGLEGFGDMFSGQNGGNNGGQGFNPYQFMPSFQQFQRPDSPVAGLSPEEEFLRQFQMGQLLGNKQGQDTAYDQLLKTVRGDYLYQDSNPYITDQINALGDITANNFNSNINDILSRAGVSGALGGSRAALMQGEAAGEATRGFNQTIADLLSNNYQRERSAQLGAIPGLLNVEGMDIQQVQQAMELAGIPRQLQQRLIDAQMAEWQRMQSERLLPVQVGQSVLGQRMGQTIPIVSPQQSPFAGMGALFSGAGQAIGGLKNVADSIGNFWGGGDPFGQQIADVGFSGYGVEPDWTSGMDAWDMGGF